MGRTRAEIQKAYRQRKKEKGGEAYMKKERERVHKYYVPIEARSKKDKIARREKVRKYVKEHRMKKKLEQARNQDKVNNEDSIDLDKLNESDENGVSSTSSSRLIVRLPAFNPKERTRKRVSRAVSKQHRKILKLQTENAQLQRKYKRVSKRLERAKKQDSGKKTTQDDQHHRMNNSTEENASYTPRKRMMTELRSVGVSPSKIPRKIKKSLIFKNVLTDEINEARKATGKKGRKVIANIVSGKLLTKYKLKFDLNRNTGINRKMSRDASKSCDKIPEHVRMKTQREQKRKRVVDFLQRDDNSRMMPGKNDKVKDNKGHVQKRVLNDNMRFLHMKYVAETSDSISFATFCRMRPKSISLTRYITKNQCLCQKHQNMALTLKSMRISGAAAPLNPDEYARKLNDNENLIDDLCDSLPEVVHHSQWKKVTLQDGKKRTKVVGEDVQKDAFIVLLRTQTDEFRKHIERVKQQYKAMTSLKENLPEGCILSQMDFAENFACGTADEVQSAYWNSNAVTLHPVVTYYRENGELKHMNYVFVSDDLGHNIGSVFAIMKKLLPEVREVLRSELHKVYYWTDSPSSQYRNKTAFYIISAHQKLLKSEAEWNYFETGHGKGACDGVGGTAKRMADLSIRQGKVSIQDAADFYRWGEKHHNSAKYILVTSAECESARKELEEINKTICPVKGTLQVHHVRAVSIGRVRTRATSCYCVQCVEGNLHLQYEEHSLVKERGKETGEKQREVETTNHEEIQEIENAESGTCHDDEEIQKIENTESGTCHDDGQLKLSPEDWVVVEYDNEWHIGRVTEVDPVDSDCMVSFMRRDTCIGAGIPSFKWPTPADEIWVSFENVLQRIEQPSKIGRSGRKVQIQKSELDSILERMKDVRYAKNH